MCDTETEDLLKAVALSPEGPALAKRLQDLTINQVAGVDRPAHRQEGFAVVKSVGSPHVGPPLDQLEARARALASSSGVSFAKAYSQVLETPEGQALYQEADATYMAEAAVDVEKNDEELLKAARIQKSVSDLMVSRAEEMFPEESTAVAMSRFMRTKDGARLYAQHEEAAR